MADTWQSGDAYERYMGRWSRLLASELLGWLDAPPGLRWLDVGCGTGALAAAIFGRCAPAAVIGVDPSPGFLAAARQRLPAEAVLHEASAARLPLPDRAVDVAVSALVLNFVPDAAAALREMTRVTVGAGLVAACVWDYAGKMEQTRCYWDAAAQLGLLAPGQDEGERFPLATRGAMEALFAGAGLASVAVAPIEIEMHFADFDDYWQPFLGGQGPAPAHAMSLDEAARGRVRELLRERLARRPDGSIRLGARAWAARGVVIA